MTNSSPIKGSTTKMLLAGERQPSGDVFASFEKGAIIVGSGCSKGHKINEGIRFAQESNALLAEATIYDVTFEDGEIRLINRQKETVHSVDDVSAGGAVLFDVLSGDGTLSTFAADLAKFEASENVARERRSAIITQGFGNGNILHIILNGDKGVRQPPQLADKSLAELQEAPFIEVSINGKKLLTPLGFGLGALGWGAKHLNNKKLRESLGYQSDAIRTIFHEGVMGLRLQERTKQGRMWTRIQTEMGELVVSAYDFANGPLLAKHMLFPDVALQDRQAAMVQLRLDELPRLAQYTYGTQTDRWNYDHLRDGEKVAFTVLDSIAGHINGDYIAIEAGSDISIKISDISFMAIANRAATVRQRRFNPTAILTGGITALPSLPQVVESLQPIPPAWRYKGKHRAP